MNFVTLFPAWLQISELNRLKFGDSGLIIETFTILTDIADPETNFLVGPGFDFYLLNLYRDSFRKVWRFIVLAVALI